MLPLSTHLHEFEGQPLVTLSWEGRPCWVARHIGARLGYSHEGKRLPNKIIGEWADEFVSGHDYAFLTGDDLEAFKGIAAGGPAEIPASTRRGLLVLFESGLHLVLAKTNLPIGKRLRRFLVDEVLPQLVHAPKVTTKRDRPSPAPEPPPSPEVQEGRQAAEGLGALGTLDELLDVLADLSDLTLSDCYGIEADSDAPLDVAVQAWRRAGCPRPPSEAAQYLAERTRWEVEAKQARLQLADADAYIESLRRELDELRRARVQPSPSTPREVLIEAMIRRHRWLLDLPDDDLLDEARRAIRSLVVDGLDDARALRLLADISSAAAALSEVSRA